MHLPSLQNACSDEQVFERKAFGQHKHITRELVLAALVVATTTAACLPDPQRMQSATLLEQLAAARNALAAQPADAADKACTTVGDVQTRLTGEPGLVDVRPAWSALHQAARALQAVCGQTTMLSQPSTNSRAMAEAQERWRQGIQREMSTACDHLRQAAAALDHAQPC